MAFDNSGSQAHRASRPHFDATGKSTCVTWETPTDTPFAPYTGQRLLMHKLRIGFNTKSTRPILVERSKWQRIRRMTIACLRSCIQSECLLRTSRLLRRQLKIALRQAPLPSENVVRKFVTISDSYSLLLRTNFLFFQKNSLFCCVGNFTASHWICSCPAHQIRCKPLNFAKFPVNFPVSREFRCRDGFASDCILHHPVWLSGALWRLASLARQLAGFFALSLAVSLFLPAH